MNGPELDALLSRLGLVDADPELLRIATTHPSWSLEHGGHDYERLEFLGDAVLGSTIAAHLFKTFPDLPEGSLTRMKVALTSGRTLAEVARSLDIGSALRLGRGAVRESERSSVLENTFEAIVGAIYLHSGESGVRDFVGRVMGDRIDPERLLATTLDAKTRLQELTQGRGLGLPAYEIVGRTGPAHDPRFTAVVRVGDEPLGTGEGRSKQEAQQSAADDALSVLDPA